ncbi:MAG TPA: TIGR02281 family clan AA aspartic protease [Chromatiales bacterium]|nr:TIGR02281 family clan AA aspartic protease [Chromatiales bacterium]
MSLGRRGRLLACGLAVAGALAWQAAAAPQVRVLALFPGKALVEVDGERRLLRAGETGPGGVRLVAADARRAVIEVGGRRAEYTVGGGPVGARYAPPREVEVRIAPDARGMYRVPGTINGQPVDFLVDTGATFVSLAGAQARALGILYRAVGDPVVVRTASGLARAWRLKLDEVQVGGIRLRSVDAVVLEGQGPAHVLLGNSFLSRLHLEREGPVLVLRMTGAR